MIVIFFLRLLMRMFLGISFVKELSLFSSGSYHIVHLGFSFTLLVFLKCLIHCICDQGLDWIPASWPGFSHSLCRRFFTRPLPWLGGLTAELWKWWVWQANSELHHGVPGQQAGRRAGHSHTPSLPAQYSFRFICFGDFLFFQYDLILFFFLDKTFTELQGQDYRKRWRHRSLALEGSLFSLTSLFSSPTHPTFTGNHIY